jgi:hypothetical protein
MHLLVDVEIGQARIDTGGYLKPILGLGWTEFRRLTTLSQGPVQVYRMSAGDYLALILDTVPGKGHDKKADMGTGPHLTIIAPRYLPSRPSALTQTNSQLPYRRRNELGCCAQRAADASHAPDRAAGTNYSKCSISNSVRTRTLRVEC